MTYYVILCINILYISIFTHTNQHLPVSLVIEPKLDSFFSIYIEPPLNFENVSFFWKFGDGSDDARSSEPSLGSFFFHAAAVFFFAPMTSTTSFSSLGFFWCPMHGVILIYTVDFWLCYI